MTDALSSDPRIIEEKQRATQWINEHWKGDRLCPICRVQQWIVSEVIQVQPVVRAGYPSTIEIFPLFPVVCGNCGYTIFFNALRSSVIAYPDGTFFRDREGAKAEEQEADAE